MQNSMNYLMEAIFDELKNNNAQQIYTIYSFENFDSNSIILILNKNENEMLFVENNKMLSGLMD